jgi:hypothetical protein
VGVGGSVDVEEGRFEGVHTVHEGVSEGEGVGTTGVSVQVDVDVGPWGL